MSVATPAAGKSHPVVFKYSNDTKTIGLVIPDISQYVKQPYTPFAPATRQGEATQNDFNITAVWEIENDWSGGTGHLTEGDTETTRYAFAQGQDLSGTTTIGPCLFTAQRGRLYPPPAETITSSIANFKQFIEFSGSWYGLTSDSAGDVYKNDGTTSWTKVEDLTAAGTQLFTDGTTLFACQGAANAVRKTTDGTTWSNHTFNAHFMAKREENNTAYITTATLTPNNDGTGPSYQSPVIDKSGTTATNMVYHAGRLWIGKPEGLTYWEQGWVYKVYDASSQPDSTNFKYMCVHKGLLWFNVKGKLFFTTGEGDPPKFTEVTPEDLNGFTAIDSMAASAAGPLLIGARMQSRSYLFYFAGVDAPGLNPLWSDSDASRPVVACGATDLFNSRPRIYLTQTTTGTVWLDFNTNWTPYTYHTKGTTQSYIDLTPFTAGFRSVPKWFYEVVLNIEPSPDTFAQIWYSIDGGSWTQMLDQTGTVVTLDLLARNVAAFFPLNTYGVEVKLRIYLFTDDGTATQAYITAVTVRGTVMPTLRNQFSFPVSAEQVVQGYTALAQDSGRNIKAALEEIAAQKYPFKFCDVDGNWHLVLLRTPYPLQSITGQRRPHGNTVAETEQQYQILLVEIDDLSSTGAYNAWEAG